MKYLISRRYKAYLFAITMLVLPAVGVEQNAIVISDHGKTTDSVVERASRGVVQELIVNIDASTIFAREEQKRVARGLNHVDPELMAETRVELASLKASIFPGGRRGGAEVKQDFSELPQLLVEIRDYPSLLILLDDPRVAR